MTVSAPQQDSRLKVLLIDNQDSFVYNLLDAFAAAGFDCTVFRNTASVQDVENFAADLVCFSPGPSHPRQAGNMMAMIAALVGNTPILGICLGYQALLEHFGGTVAPCGPVHGSTDEMTLTDAGVESGLFKGLTVDDDATHGGWSGRGVRIARYHSLGCRFTPSGIVSLAECDTKIGPVTMAGMTDDGLALGLQFHPESVLSPTGPEILARSVRFLVDNHHAQKETAAMATPDTADTPSTVTDEQKAQARADLRAFLFNHTPSDSDVETVFHALAQGIYTNEEITALLVAINTRGITPADLTGAARAFIGHATDFPDPKVDTVDCCGTGGDGAHTINVSTTAALVAAAMGIPMVKHGNRSVSSTSGSADVLEALSIPLDLAPEHASQAVAEDNFAFLFAPRYHPAIAHVMPVRKALAIPTIFNVLGPLLNPAHPTYQLMGIANPALGQNLIEVLKNLGRRRALVVHGSGIDEIAVHGPTEIFELTDNGEITHTTITPEDLGLTTHSLEDLRGGDGKDNATITRAILAGHGTAAQRDAVAANAGALLYLTGKADTLKNGVQQAAEFIDSGKAAAVIDTFQQAR